MAGLTYNIRANDQFSGTFDKLINMSSMASSFIIANLGMAAGRAIMDMTENSVDAFADVELSLRRITSAVGDYGKAADQMMYSLEANVKVGAELGFTMSQTASVLKDLVMAGYNVEDAMKVLTPTLQIATIEEMNLVEATQLTASMMRMFGIEAKNASRVSDVLAAAARESVLPISKLGMGLSYVGQTASSSGSSLEEVAAALVMATNEGLKAHMAGRYLRRIFTDLIQEEDRLGFSIRSNTGDMVSLTVIVERLNDYLNSLSTAYERQNYLVDVFGVQSKTLIDILTDMGAGTSKSVDELKRLTEEFGGTGYATEMAGGIMESFSKTLDKLKSNLSAISFEFGKTLAPMILALTPILITMSQTFATVVTPAINMAIQAVNVITPAITAFASILQTIGPTLVNVGTKYIMLSTTIKVLTGAYWSLQIAIHRTMLAKIDFIKISGNVQTILRLFVLGISSSSASMSVFTKSLEGLSPTLAAIIPLMRGIKTATFESAGATLLYTNGLKVLNFVEAIGAKLISFKTAVMNRLTASTVAATAAANGLALATGFIVITAAVVALAVAVKWLSKEFKARSDAMKTAWTSNTNSIIMQIDKLTSTMDTFNSISSMLSIGLNSLSVAYDETEQRIKLVEKAISIGTMTALEGAVALDALRTSGAELADVMESARSKQGQLNNEMEIYVSELNSTKGELEKLKTAQEMLLEIQNQYRSRTKASVESITELKEILAELGITVDETTKGFSVFKTTLVDIDGTMKKIDSAVTRHSKTQNRLALDIDAVNQKIIAMDDYLGMTEAEYSNFWDSLANMTITRGATMMSVLDQLTGAMKGLEYVSGATGREIQRLDLRYRENELMIREIEKSMRSGITSYREGASAIIALRKENEELALARDEARLEQDKINLAMDEANATIKAYQAQLLSLKRNEEAALARKAALEEKSETAAGLTEDEKEELEQLEDVIVELAAATHDYTRRLDDVIDQFPAMETALLNLRGGIKDFASDLESNAQVPLDGIYDTLTSLNTTDFSTEFDFVYDEVDWDSFVQTIHDMADDEDWFVEFGITADTTGLDAAIAKAEILIGYLDEIERRSGKDEYAELSGITTTGGNGDIPVEDRDRDNRDYIDPNPFVDPPEIPSDDIGGGIVGTIAAALGGIVMDLSGVVESIFTGASPRFPDEVVIKKSENVRREGDVAIAIEVNIDQKNLSEDPWQYAQEIAKIIATEVGYALE